MSGQPKLTKTPKRAAAVPMPSIEENSPLTYVECWKVFHEFVIAEWAANLHLKATAGAAIEEHKGRALQRGRSNGLIPLEAYYTPLELSRACSGPVTLTQEAAPTLIRFLRLNLALLHYERREAQLLPFHSEALGDDTAADWSSPDVARGFAELFNEMLCAKPDFWRRWNRSKLTIDELIDDDLQDESGAFKLTIVER